MAGVTDQPFRRLCRRFGAGLTPSEMITSNIRLWHREKCRLRRRHDGEQEPRVVQIAGADPVMMAEAARLNAEQGAQIIDINMGCPAKKVLKRSAGSALLQYPALVEEILNSVVSAVDVPVTLKIRTGWDPDNRNGTDIARLAEDCGIQSLAVHGRTRACAFRGEVEYDTIAAIKAAVSIPVFANGDIDSAHQARQVLDYTGADGVMIGRAAQGQPWIFSDMNYYLEHGVLPPARSLHDIHGIAAAHVRELHQFYGEDKGLFFARKHVAWYLSRLLPEYCQDGIQLVQSMRQHFNRLQDCSSQTEYLDSIFEILADLQQKQEARGMAA